MRSITLSIVLVLICACSVPKLPDAGEQAAMFARQPFTPDYQVAITSFFKPTKVLVDASTPYVRFVSSLREARRIALHERTARDFIESDFSTGSGMYNLGSWVSQIERSFGEALQRELGIVPIYYPRNVLQKQLDKQFLETSVMMHAKVQAAEEGLDAVLVVYFEPYLAESRSVLGLSYRLSYQTQVAMRSIADDRLIYNKISQYACTRDLVSPELSKREEAILAMDRCEQEIHTRIIDDFVAFARDARKATL